MYVFYFYNINYKLLSFAHQLRPSVSGFRVLALAGIELLYMCSLFQLVGASSTFTSIATCYLLVAVMLEKFTRELIGIIVYNYQRRKLTTEEIEMFGIGISLIFNYYINVIIVPSYVSEVFH